ncbi:telomere length and silencing protein 1 homolog [Gigantopelta aegis]|uniref:telomere length and silencing protein 1 homolog n=1 Tax=Gigantopelta aegis TaxID=1735272 RepID=UPI001B8888CC|nr:telomere length and silencing protein 1 homolog [Gigantopelta aegis]
MAENKRKKCKQFRKRKHSSNDDDDLDGNDESSGMVAINDIKDLQKMRNRQKGVSAASLALGKKIEKAEQIENADPFKMKTGGFVDMKQMKKIPLSGEEATSIGTTFAAETNRRDEDAEMFRYVEEELARRKGLLKKEDEDYVRCENPEDTLYKLPEHLQVKSTTKRSEDMLSNQMLSGIPEVDLGIEAKIRNIEATEEAKDKLLLDKLKKKENEVSDFVPTNMAVNFVQHNRFNIDDSSPLKKKPEIPAPKPLRVGDWENDDNNRGKISSSRSNEKATDDFHYEKFKKQMRR